MSDSFNVFGFNHATNQLQNKFGSTHTLGNPIMKAKSFVNQTDPVSNKVALGTAAGVKPKGLSFRSKVDPNINLQNENVFNKVAGKTNPKLSNSKSSLHVLSTRQEEKKSEVSREKNCRAPLTNAKSPHSTLQTFPLPSTFLAFKKPSTLRKKVPEPEQLSNDWSEEKYFHRMCPEKVLKADIEFCNVFLSRPKLVVPFEDECLKSEPELRSIPNLPFSSHQSELPVFHEDDLKLEIPCLPLLDDDDDEDDYQSRESRGNVVHPT